MIMHFHWSSLEITTTTLWSSSRYIFCVQNHFIESGNFFSSSSFKEVGIRLIWCFLVKDDCMNFSDREINSLCVFILIIDWNPLFNKPSWNILDIFGNLKGSKLFLFHDHIIFSCFWWLTKLSSVRCLLCHLSEHIMSLRSIKILDRKNINIAFVLCSAKLISFLESLFSSDI